MPPKRISKKKVPAKKLDMINPFAEGADEILKKRAEKKTQDTNNPFGKGADQIKASEIHPIHKNGYKRGSLEALIRMHKVK